MDEICVAVRRAKVEEEAAPINEPHDGECHQLEHVQVPCFVRVGAEWPAEEVAER